MRRKLLLACLAPLVSHGAALECKQALERGVSEYRAGRWDKALADVNAALECDPGMTVARVVLGDVYVKLGNETEGLRAYSLVLSAQPDNTEALRGAAAVYLRHDNNEKAAPLLERLVTLLPADAQAHANLGAADGANGRADEAEREFGRAIELDPKNASALTGKGSLLQKQGETEAAIPLLQRAAQLAPGAYEPHFVLGTIFNAQGKYPEAKRELEAALRLGGDGSSEVYYQLARADLNLGLTQERQQALARFTALNEQAAKDKTARNSVFVLVSKAKTQIDSGDLTGAAVNLEEASKLGEPDHEILFRLAGLQYDLKRYDAATTNVKRAISLAPSVWIYRFLLGLIQSDTGKLSEARANLELAVHLNANAAEAYQALGQVCQRQNDLAGAEENFKRAAALGGRK